MVTYELTLLGVLVAILVGGGTTLWLLARHDRDSPAAAFGAFMLAMTYWSVTHLGTLLAESLQWQLAFTQLSYVASSFAPLVWLVFALRYTGRADWLSTRRLAALSGVPAATVALVATTQHHGLVYADTWMAPAAGHPLLHVEYGPWFLLAVLYSYVLLLAGTGVLFAAALSYSRLYRRQATVLVGAITIPWLVNVIYNFGVRPIPWIDPTPVAFVATGIPLGLVVVRSDLASHLPVAHERLFRTLGDPILVVAPDDTVIDANRAARRILGGGDPLDRVDAATVLPDGVAPTDDAGPTRTRAATATPPDTAPSDATVTDARTPNAAPSDATVTDARTPDTAPSDATTDARTVAVDHDGETHTYVVRQRAVAPDGERGSRGTLVTLTDVTVQRRQRERLEEKTARLENQADRLAAKNEQLERLADIVSHDLQGPLSTAEKLTTLLERDLADPDPPVRRTLADLAGVHERLRGFADHLPRLARESTDVEATAACDLATVATDAWTVVETGDVALVTESTRTVLADRSRLRQVFENLFWNSIEHGVAVGTGSGASTDGGEADWVDGRGEPSTDRDGTVSTDLDGTVSTDLDGTVSTDLDGTVSTVRVGATDDGFYVADDGPGVPDGLAPEVFEYGVSSGDGSGFGLAIVRTVVEAHGWTIDLTESDRGGARFEVVTDA